ncbi:hypothetical protein BS78_01G233900 [Paspalum vaginatum]|nr:hypothetical protein BS78_01G233900 [Paspalum vaginatum]
MTISRVLCFILVSHSCRCHRVLAAAGVMEKDDVVEVINVDQECDLLVGYRRASRTGGMNVLKDDCVATAARQKSLSQYLRAAKVSLRQVRKTRTQPGDVRPCGIQILSANKDLREVWEADDLADYGGFNTMEVWKPGQDTSLCVEFCCGNRQVQMPRAQRHRLWPCGRRRHDCLPARIYKNCG